MKFCWTPIPEPLGVISRKFAQKVAKSKYFLKFKLNRNLQTIPFKMMYNMSMLRHRFSNEQWGGGGGGGGRPEPPSSLILYKCACNFHVETFTMIFLHIKPDYSIEVLSYSMNLCQKLTCTMHTNIDDPKIHKIFEPETSRCSENRLCFQATKVIM